MRVIHIGRDRAAEAADVLAGAFLNESATDYFFPPEEGGKLEKLRALFGWAVEYRMRTGLPVLGVERRLDGRLEDRATGVSPTPPPLVHPSTPSLTGVATLRTPIMPDLAEAEAMWREVANFIGPGAESRMERYEELQKRHLPSVPHHYLVAIGVLPSFQGQGYGGVLLRGAIAMAEADPQSKGIALDTGSDSNQALYERFGFQLTAAEALADKTARFMFRPNP